MREFSEILSPILRRETLKLAAWVDLGADEREPCRFEREIIWLAETSAKYRLLLEEDELVKTGSTYSDFYGLGTSIEEAVKEAAKRPRKHLTLEVLVEYREFPAIQVQPDERRVARRTAVCYKPAPQWAYADDAYTAWVTSETPVFAGDLGVRWLEANSSEHIVWRNGEWTDAGHSLLAHINRLRGDAGKPPIPPSTDGAA